MANVFIVAPESLSTLFEGTPSIRKDAQRYNNYIGFVNNAMLCVLLLAVIIILPSHRYRMANNDIYMKKKNLFLFLFNFLALLN